MIAKAHIVEDVGAGSLLLPDLVGDALLANDQVKYLFTLLQASRQYADHRAEGTSNLRSEREACRLEDVGFDTVVPGSQLVQPGRYLIPLAPRIHREITDRVERMLKPLVVADGLVDQHDTASLVGRWEALIAGTPDIEGNVVPADYVRWATQARREEGDSLHLLVMDLHQQLHRLQGGLAQESVDGAKVFGLTASDQARVAAFMRGLNGTARLKFDHPGLGTTAMRAGDTLTIENDIGSTDAHVIVLTIRGHTATLTYADVHRRRADFFRDMLDAYPVEWSDAQQRRCEALREEADYRMITGRLAARNTEELDAYLEHLGSRVVFLIDWNRARKRLRRFVKKSECIPLLRWAADHNVGHRAFLQLGGEQLLYDAVERVGQGRVRYGQRLDEVLGKGDTVALLRHVLRATSEGLVERRSRRFIEDEIDAELLRCLQGAPEGVLDLVSQHAALLFELASGVRDGLVRAPGSAGAEFRQRAAHRAAGWERQADGVVERVRVRPGDSAALWSLGQGLRDADRAADRLEVATFALSLFGPGNWEAGYYAALTNLASLVLQETQEFVKAAENAAAASRDGTRVDVQDFLEAVENVVALEQRSDDAEREVVTTTYEQARDFRELHLVASMAGSLERVGDALVGAALHLRDFVLDRADESRGT